MQYVMILFITYSFLGCADHYNTKPFECRCDCNASKFECIGEESVTKENAVAKAIKKAF